MELNEDFGKTRDGYDLPWIEDIVSVNPHFQIDETKINRLICAGLKYIDMICSTL